MLRFDFVFAVRKSLAGAQKGILIAVCIFSLATCTYSGSGAETAAMRVPYVNTTNKGVLIHDQATLTAKVRLALSKRSLARVVLWPSGWRSTGEGFSGLMGGGSLVTGSCLELLVVATKVLALYLS